MRLRVAGRCWTVIALIAAASTPEVLAEEGAGSGNVSDCQSVKVRWLQFSGPGESETAFEKDVQERLKKSFTWSSYTSVTSVEDLAAEVRRAESPLTILSCGAKTYSTFASQFPRFEILNARMWARPVYVFVRNGGAPAERPILRAAFIPPPDLQVDERKLTALMADVLGKQVVLEPLRNVKSLKEELAATQGSRYDAVILYGQEPSPLIDSFLGLFQEGRDNPPLLRAADLGARTPRRMVKSSQGLQFTFLEYPGDTFYNTVRLAAGDRDITPVTVGVPQTQEDWSAGLSLPLLLTDGRPGKPGGGLTAPCWGILRRVIGDAALAAARRLGGGPQDTDAFAERELLMFALLSTRGEERSDRRLEEVLRGLSLAGGLVIRGNSEAARTVQAMIKQPFEAAHGTIVAQVSQLNTPFRDTLRGEFSGDPLGLQEDARKVLDATGLQTERGLQVAWGQLLAAVKSRPIPARYAGGNGLTKVVAYNPYLDLAHSWATRRPQSADNRPPADFRFAALLLAVEDVHSDEADSR